MKSFINTLVIVLHMGAKALTLFLILFLADIVLAANIQGTIYDLELNKAGDVLVQIDTKPKQQIVSKSGEYSFEVQTGDYTIKASQKELGLYAEEKISVIDVGDYILDLILYPNFEEQELLEETDLEIGDVYLEERSYKQYYMLAGLISLIILVYLAFNYLKKQKKEEDVDDDLKKIIRFIKKEGGRVTQKDLRKQFPLSEAKISLMISELEHKGILEKIKKGRGNIIILKR